MTDYNDGKWHGWNGGECPVHPETEIETRHLLEGKIDGSYCSWAGRIKNAAGFFSRACWAHDNVRPDSAEGDNPIIAFRVVKEYREPREAWAFAQKIYDTAEAAEAAHALIKYQYPEMDFGAITRWIEVVE